MSGRWLALPVRVFRSGAGPLVLCVCLCGQACGVGIVDESADYTVETVCEGLEDPTGLAVRRWSSDEPPHEFFVAESGAGRVRQVLSDEPPQLAVAVEGFPQGGPMSLVLTTRTRLLVGSPAGAANFMLPREEAVLQAGESGQAASIAAAPDGPVEFWGLALADGPAAVFAAVQAGRRGAVLIGEVSGNRVEKFGVLADEGLRRPRGIALTPSDRPRFVVVADSGGDEPGDSSLHFFKPHNGELALSLPVSLSELCGVAYSPRGELYAVNGVARPEGGGLYRLDEVIVEGRQQCRPALIALLQKPAAMSFAPDGDLYVASLGGHDAEEAGGTLVRVSGGF